jgi:HK97 family phage major capsid protein
MAPDQALIAMSTKARNLSQNSAHDQPERCIKMTVAQKRSSTFAQTIKAIHVGQGNEKLAISWVETQCLPNVRAVVESIKAAVDANSTISHPLASPASLDFADLVRPLTIIGKLASLRRVPSRVRAISAIAGSGASWAGEAQPRPISRMTLAGDILEQLSVISIVVCAVELLQSSAPSADSLIERDCAAAAVQALDVAFIDPDNSGQANVMPASITNGVSPIPSTGQTLANIDTDLAALIQALSNAGSDLTTAVFILNPRTALFLSRLRGSGGALAYPEMGVGGGVLLGLPAITSAAVPIAVGSPGVGLSSITLLDQSQVLISDDGAASFSVHAEASVQMKTAPGSGAQQLVGLFQTNSAAIKSVRFANWKRCRDGVAQVLTNVAY